MAIKNIGFIGIGTMGKGMVQNLLKNNFNVLAYNRTKKKIEEVKRKNLNIIETPKDACKADVVITCVSNDAALNDVLFSRNGVFKDIGKNNILMDCGTTSIEFTKKINGECNKKNVDFLDAPITGSKIGAETGNLLFMVGGKKELFDKCMPIFNAMGKKAVYCGGNAQGQKAKIALNLAQSMILQGYLEGIILGMKNGVGIEAMREIFENSGARTGIGSFKLPYLINRDFKPHFKLELMNKDIKLAINEIKKLDLSLPLSKEINNVFDKAMRKGWEKEDFVCIARLLEEDAGIKFK